MTTSTQPNPTHGLTQPTNTSSSQFSEHYRCTWVENLHPAPTRILQPEAEANFLRSICCRYLLQRELHDIIDHECKAIGLGVRGGRTVSTARKSRCVCQTSYVSGRVSRYVCLRPKSLPVLWLSACYQLLFQPNFHTPCC